MAFEEDSSQYSTFENGHICKFILSFNGSTSQLRFPSLAELTTHAAFGYIEC